MTEAIDLSFDPMCPHAYQTPRWIREVRTHVGVDVNVEVLLARGAEPRRRSANANPEAFFTPSGAPPRRR